MPAEVRGRSEGWEVGRRGIFAPSLSKIHQINMFVIFRKSGCESVRTRLAAAVLAGLLAAATAIPVAAQTPEKAPKNSVDHGADPYYEPLPQEMGAAGLKLARALAMATYRSPIEFALRFGGAPIRSADRFRFPIEDYLFARGDDYVQNYRAESFLALSESIDLHAMDATQVHTPATLIAVREDQLVPFNDMQALSARLNGPRQLIEINSIFGHDAFLKEAAALTPIIKHALAEHQP